MSFNGRPEDSWGREDPTAREPHRRRSPGRRQHDNRRRSRSPQIDRYQPGRPRPDGTHERRDDYRRRSPPPAPQANIDRYVPGQEAAGPVVNPLPHPLTLEYQVGFNWFAEWWRKDQEVKEERERQKTGARRPPPRLKGEQESREERDKEREKIQAGYDEYKLKFLAQMSRAFVQQHKDHEWFKERYDPDVLNPFRAKQSAFRKINFDLWQTELEAGGFDEFSLEGIYKSESNGAGGVVEKEEGETTAAAEVLGVGDLLPSRGADMRDEAALQPALLIKTIAPHVSRDKIEAFCKEHIGEDEGGFRWLSLSDPNLVKKCHRIGWVLLNPGGDQTIEVEKKDDRGDGRDEEAEEDAEAELQDRMEEVTTETATKPAVDIALEAINGKSITLDEDKGTFVCHVGVHVSPPSPRKKALWDLFSAPERIERDLELAIRLVNKLDTELGPDSSAVQKIEQRIEEIRNKGLLQPQSNGSANKPPKESNGDGSGDDDEEGEMDDEEEGAWDEEVDDEELLTKKKKLDLLVEYLRRVHNFCFFCVFESDSVHELTRKCPGGHLRRPRASLTSSAKAAAKATAYGEPFPLKKGEPGADKENEDEGSPTATKRYNRHNKAHQQLQRAFTWVKTYEDKLFQILEPESVDLKKLGGRPMEEALEEELKKFVKQEDEAKFRCKVPECTKLFRGENFWRKHVEKRHVEWFDAKKKDIYLINAYVLDPAHVTPAKPEVVNTGPFPPNAVPPTGTPRGFSLSNIPGGYPNPMAAMPNGAGFPPMAFGPYPVGMPGHMAGMPPHFAMDPNVGHVGPMRRNRGGFNGNRAMGPYDRNQKQGMRWGGPGRLTPPRGGGKMGGPPGMGMQRFPDGGLPSAVGPKEAVAGRSLKNYEDLDAVGGEGNGELDY